MNEHLPPEARAYLMQTPQWCLEHAERIGPMCRELVDQLFASRVLDNLRAAQGVLGLKKKYGPKRLEAACRRAVEHGTASYRAVKSIQERGWTWNRRTFASRFCPTPTKVAAGSAATPETCCNKRRNRMKPMSQLAPLLKQLQCWPLVKWLL